MGVREIRQLLFIVFEAVTRVTFIFNYFKLFNNNKKQMCDEER